MISSILLAVDASPHALVARDQAFMLARAYGTRITVVSVLDVRLLEMPPYLDYAYPFETIALPEFPVELLESFRAKAERVLQDVEQAAEDQGLEVEVRLEEGVPSVVIAEVGGARDLIVLGKRGEHAKWGKDLLGSVAERVVRRAKSPVLLTESVVSPLQRCVVLYDASPSADRALQLAADIATHLGGALQVLTACASKENIEQMHDRARALLDSYALQVGYVGLEGRVVQAVQDHLTSEPADLVVMGKKGHSLLERLILGSTAEHLMRILPLPVLLVP